MHCDTTVIQYGYAYQEQRFHQVIFRLHRDLRPTVRICESACPKYKLKPTPDPRKSFYTYFVPSNHNHRENGERISELLRGCPSSSRILYEVTDFIVYDWTDNDIAHAVKSDGKVYVSGSIGCDRDWKVVPGGVQPQTVRIF